MLIIWVVAMLAVSCDSGYRESIDRLNDEAYDQHYRDLGATLSRAIDAYRSAENYHRGRAEALNNIAFVGIAKMKYHEAYVLLSQVDRLTDDQTELLVADVQRMRLCQRESKNREFYGYMQSARKRLSRIAEEGVRLTDRQQRRLTYAESELCIIASTYYYYLGLYDQSADAIKSIRNNQYIERDTAQLLNYYYVVGSGGIVKGESREAVFQQEMDYLMRCLHLARQYGYPYWEANSLQAICEHLQEDGSAVPAMMPSDLAQRALELFSAYGDVYQTAGAYRTIAQCYWETNDYQQAIENLNNALTRNTAIEQAPDLVASIREQLSLAYAAINDKAQSDFNRNIYLDLQEQTRQDRQLEARVEQLSTSSAKLNTMISAVIQAILVSVVLLILFSYMRRQSDRRYSIPSLLQPMSEWTRINNNRMEQRAEEMEKLAEQTAIVRRHIENNRKRNLEQRAKVALVNSITPLIDRIIHEINQIVTKHDEQTVVQERFAYVAELSDQINDYNRVLTQWIQMRQGELSLHIESFALKELLDILQRGRMSFQMKGVSLDVADTTSVVKADKALTLFMLNTIADNARKFTPRGGSVTVGTQEADDYVEISISDTGIGLTEEEQKHVFDHKPIIDVTAHDQPMASHGFGLMNCKGIIEKYRKVSRIFSVCDIGVESKKNQGSRFFFRLPKGVLRMLLLFVVGSWAAVVHAQASDDVGLLLDEARMLADSVYFSNINGDYDAALDYAEHCIDRLNRRYRAERPQGDELMELYSERTDEPAELRWWHENRDTDFSVILDLRNEVAVAALALHEWSLYHYNNKVYTQLFREQSADPSLAAYVNMMQLSETNKNVAVALLVILLILLFPAYYFLYYRHSLHYRFLIDRINSINQTLLSDQSAQEKLHVIDQLWTRRRGENTELEAVVDHIRHSLVQAIDMEKASSEEIELAKDELRRVNYENDRLYVANSVMDNCLSTLKHETMYFPSRIRQLIDGEQPQAEAIAELSRYYKELFATLAAQANRQTEGSLRIDGEMMKYLFGLFANLNKGRKPTVTEKEWRSGYVKVNLTMDSLVLTADECQCLFTPQTIDVGYLLCRQIIREMGEENNARGCGILAYVSDCSTEGTPIVEITLTDKIWKDSKLSL